MVIMDRAFFLYVLSSLTNKHVLLVYIWCSAFI